MSQLNKVLQWIDENESEVVAFLQDIIRIPSVNPWFEDDEYPTKEKEIQIFLEKTLQQLGFETRMWEPVADDLAKYEGRAGYYAGRDFTDRPNLYGELKGSGEGKSILLTGHVDVVKAGTNWTTEPFGAEVIDGKIYGRGTTDMKGGIAAMIMAVKAIVDSGIKLAGTIKVGTVADEEAGGMGTLAFVHEGYRADACILTEPTALSVAPLCRGILWGKLIIEGKSGHIEMPQGDWRTGGAVDAIEKTSLYLEHFRHLNADWAVRKTHPLLPIPCQLLVAEIHVGEYPTSFANRSEITFNAQYLPSERDELLMGGHVKREIESFVQAIAQTDPWLKENPPRIEWMIDADCGETSADHEFVQTFTKSLERIGEEVKVEGICSHTDMGWFVNVGIPIVNFGPGEPRIAHQSDEHVSIDELIRSTKAIAATILSWCDTKEE